MKVRVKYTKTGSLKFISHLDVMRHFQKNIRRAGLDIAYSTGLSPHQIISFAAPMPLMLTSEAEFFDAEFNSLPSREEFIRRMNETGVPDLKVLDVAILPDKALNAMAAVTASLYRITMTERGEAEMGEAWREKFPQVIRELSAEKEIIVVKKTKTKEEPTDIRPMIRELDMEQEGECRMFLAAGSKINLRPETVLSEICRRLDIPYIRFHYDILRLETYMDAPEGKGFRSLIEVGNREF